MRDDSIAFTANPVAFIAANPIVLNFINANLAGGAIPAVNNLRTRFTLSTNTVGGVAGPGQFPCLRMQPIGGPAIVPIAGGGVLTTIDALYCNAGNGAMAYNNLPYCDIAIAPGPADAHFLFTTGMNGCSLVVASAVPIGVPPLAPGHWRVMHDHNHHSLAQWQAAGYTIRFASYTDLAQAGPIPVAFIPPTIVNTYNPHGYPWGYMAPPLAPPVRIVTNFLHWNGANWTFNSKHYHASGVNILNVDTPPGVMPVAPSTQTVAV